MRVLVGNGAPNTSPASELRRRGRSGSTMWGDMATGSEALAYWLRDGALAVAGSRVTVGASGASVGGLGELLMYQDGSVQ